MDPIDFVTPHPALITELSPSLANQLMACQLRVAFSRDPDQSAWSRPSTYAALGLAAHAVTEAAFKRRGWPNDAGGVRAQIEELWEAKVERGAANLAVAWAPAVPPSPPDWPGYALTRARTIRRATKLLTTPPSERPKRGGGTGVEVELRDPRSGLVGRADRIERDGSSTRVVDLKTGLNQDEPTEDQRRQLLMYAILVHRTTGEWPSSIAVEDASGFQHVLPLDPAVAESSLRQVESAVTSFNQRAAAEELVASADPTPDRCRWCPYRVLCQPFWEALTSDWGQAAVLGAIHEAGASESGAFVALVVESPADRRGRKLHVSGLSKSLPETDAKAAVVDWVGSPGSGAVRARWSTTVRSW